MLTTTSKNTALDALDAYQWLSLHTTYSAAGAYEFVGGTYARQQAIFDIAAGGLKSILAPVTFTTPPSDVVRWIGAWDAPVAGNFLGMAPNLSGAPTPFCCTDTATGVCFSPAHALIDTNTVFLWAGSGILPTGLQEGVPYDVVTATTDTFQISFASSIIVPTASGIGYVQRYTSTFVDGVSDFTVLAFSIDANLF